MVLSVMSLVPHGGIYRKTGIIIICLVGQGTGKILSSAGARKIPHDVRQRAEESAHERWQLLLQLNESMLSGFCFSDGLLQFFISKEDVAVRRFDRVWFAAQSS